MSNFEYVVDIHAPTSHVWSVLVDVERWPEWTTSVTSAQRMEIGPLTLGSRTRLTQPRLSKAVWKVTSLDRARGIFAWSTHALGVKIVAYHQVEMLGSGSRVTLLIHYAGLLGPWMARLLRDLNWDYLAREGNGLKRFCEAQVAEPALSR